MKVKSPQETEEELGIYCDEFAFSSRAFLLSKFSMFNMIASDTGCTGGLTEFSTPEIIKDFHNLLVGATGIGLLKNRAMK